MNPKLCFYDSLSRSKRDFTPIDAANVRMYVCGPTVYDNIHIGNARPLIVFDTLYRLLCRVYGFEQVTYVRNITDIDDRINERARELGVPISELTRDTVASFREDCRYLECLAPSVEPRATETIDEMIEMINQLLSSDSAYTSAGHVYFDVNAARDYGILSGRRLIENRTGTRVSTSENKRNAADFVLWKPSDSQTAGWESDWGRGRPGWHIECSAMAKRHLGDSFDIHGGGLDLLFPHHENEIAQSCTANGTDRMANFWLHNELVNIENEKMSKSLGNMITVKELAKDWSSSTLRLEMLSTHYRAPLSWSAERLSRSEKTIDNWSNLVNSISARDDKFSDQRDDKCLQVDDKFLAALCNDLNSPLAIARMHELTESEPELLRSSMELLGLKAVTQDYHTSFKAHRRGLNIFEINALAEKRVDARNAKDYARADSIRDQLAALGVKVIDGTKSTWLIES